MSDPAAPRFRGALEQSRLLRALVVYVSLSWAILQGVDFLTNRLGLPDWVFPGVFILLLFGLPVVIATAVVRRDWLTWRRAILGGAIAMTGWTVLVGGYMGARAMGIGPAGTLVARGDIAQSDKVLIAEFENATADSTLGRTIRQALAVDLSQSRVLRVVEPREAAAALRRMQKDPTSTPLTSELAREVAQREGMKAVLEGSVSSLGTATVITVRLVTARDGELLTEFEQTARRPEDLLDAVDALGGKLRDRVGESLRVIRADPPLAQVTTASLEALRLYTEGSKAIDVAGDNQKAIKLFEQAVEVDSTFAMAWRRIGAAALNLNYRPKAFAAFRKAYALRDRLTERERGHAAAAFYRSVERDLRKGAAAYEALLSTFPDDVPALVNLGQVYTALHELDKAAALEARAIALDTTNPTIFTNAALTLAMLGKARESEKQFARAARLAPTADLVLRVGPNIAAARGDYATALSRVDSALARIPAGDMRRRTALAMRGALLAQQGQLTDAERAFREAEPVQPGRTYPSFGWLTYRLRSHIARGELDQAAAMLDGALEELPLENRAESEGPELYDLAELYAQVGRPAEARLALAAADRLGAVPDYGFKDRVLGLIALAEKNHEEAIRRLKAATDVGACLICTWYHLGRAYEAAGQSGDAIDAYARFVDTPDGNGRTRSPAVFLGLGLERLAALQEAAGDRTNAARSSARLLELYKNADPALQPYVTSARTRLQRLSGEPRQP